MLMKVGKLAFDTKVTDNGRAFRVVQTIKPHQIEITDTIRPILRHSISKKSKKKH